VGYKTFIFSILVIFLPIKPVLLTVLTLVGVDLIGGLMAAKKRKEPITSSGFKRTIVKLFVYELVIILAHITTQYLTGDMIPLVKILAGYIGITELKSCMENMEELTGVPVLKALIDKITQAGQ